MSYLVIVIVSVLLKTFCINIIKVKLIIEFRSILLDESKPSKTFDKFGAKLAT